MSSGSSGSSGGCASLNGLCELSTFDFSVGGFCKSLLTSAASMVALSDVHIYIYICIHIPPLPPKSTKPTGSAQNPKSRSRDSAVQRAQVAPVTVDLAGVVVVAAAGAHPVPRPNVGLRLHRRLRLGSLHRLVLGKAAPGSEAGGGLGAKDLFPAAGENGKWKIKPGRGNARPRLLHTSLSAKL